jgi:hypothetical protein
MFDLFLYKAKIVTIAAATIKYAGLIGSPVFANNHVAASGVSPPIIPFVKL